MSEEAPLTVTLKLPGAASPWLVLRSANAAQASAQMNEIISNGLGADLGRAQQALEAQYNAGHILDARPVEAPVNGGAFNAPQAAPQVAPAPQYQQPIQQAPEFVQQAAGPNYQAPQQQTAQQYAQAAANGYQQQQAPQQQYQPQGSAPGAPLVNGQPAKLISGEKNGRKWQAWADPRSKSETEGMQRTDDPNHPGIAMGTHSLFKFIR